MGVPIVTIGHKHVCPQYDGKTPHVGGTVIEGVQGVYLDGIPVAVVGSKCICTGSGKPNSISKGCDGIFVDGEPIAMVGSMTEHGGIVMEGNPGITITGSFAQHQGDKEKPEPRIFNLQWRNKENIVKYGQLSDTVILSADTIGYADNEEVTIKVYAGDMLIDEVLGLVTKNRVEVDWKVKTITEE